jgi:hypothetical protein
MKFHTKEVARHLLAEDINTPVFLKRQLAQQLFRSGKRLPQALRNWITKKIFQRLPSASNQEEALEEELAPTAFPIAEVKKTRRQFTRRPKETSNWWSQFLTATQRLVLQNDKKHRDTLMFKTLFRVDIHTFYVLRDIILDREWYDPEVSDLFGRRCHHVELLLLGCLHVLGHDATQKVCESNTHISSECHRKFFLRWCKDMASIKDEFIFLPADELELDRVLKSYSRYGFVGCIGSIDCVHIGWDKCPSEWRPLFVGKEGFPTIVFQVTCDNHHKIQAVSQGHPGARNDKTIVKLDDAVATLKSKNSWLGSMPWILTIASGMKKMFGYYLICDGGYLRWPCLVTGLNDDTNHSMRVMNKKLGSIRKDIECTFGAMKKRFKWLKNWNSLAYQANIDNVFTTCCILHNILLEHDGYLASDFALPKSGSLSKLVIPGDRGDGMQMRVRDGAVVNTMDDEEPDGGAALAAEWKKRIIVISEHIEREVQAHPPNSSDSD